MKPKPKPVHMLITLGLSVLPVTVLAHQGHANSLWHAFLHLLEANGVWLVLLSLAIMASLVLNGSQRRSSAIVGRGPIDKEQDHDSR